MTLAGAVLILALCLVVVLSLTVWALLAQVRDWRSACLAERQRVADDAVELLRLKSLVAAIQGTLTTTGYVDTEPGSRLKGKRPFTSGAMSSGEALPGN